jgi:hypothetical protein
MELLICPKLLCVDQGLGDDPQESGADEEDKRYVSSASGSGAMPEPSATKTMKVQEKRMPRPTRTEVWPVKKSDTRRAQSNGTIWFMLPTQTGG